MLKILLVILSALPAYSSLYAKDFYDLPPVVAVQNKEFSVVEEYTLHGGFLPSDAFNKGYTIGLSYLHNINSYLSWEVLNASYSFNEVTTLNKDINTIPNIDLVDSGVNEFLDFINYFVTSSILYTPIYSKNLIFNESIIHSDFSFALGLGFANFNDAGIVPMANVGAIMKFFLSANSALKFDFRNNLHLKEKQGVINSWSFQIGYSFLINETKPQHSKELIPEI